MKKYFMFVFAFVALTALSFAQMQIGPKAGLNLSTLNGSDVDNAESKTGFVGGIFFMYQFSNMFAVQPEAYYTMKGAKSKGNLEGYDYTATWSLDYIEIPVLLKLIIPLQNTKINPAIFAGPSVAFNTTHKIKVEAGGQSSEQDISDITSTDFGLVFGGGVGFPVSNNELGFDVRYTLGLATIDDSAEKADVKNGVWSFNLYFGFSLQ